ncbi:MAG: hypothetical protein IJ777_03345 [Clostridia bacterium]|nr:hypothetical protein [Clostridia bacterium]
MNFHKCSRCGCFFVTDSNVCPNCEPKDKMEMSVLKSFLLDTMEQNKTVENISASTGISAKNIERFLAQKEFATFAIPTSQDGTNLDIRL